MQRDLAEPKPESPILPACTLSLSHVIHINNEKIIHLGGREQEGGECVWTCTSGGKAFRRREERVKQLASLLNRFLPLLHRAKYFHGKKVNGEIEIRVEQVGWS